MYSLSACCQAMEKPKLYFDFSIPGQLPFSISFKMEMRGLEPLTSSLQRRRSPD